MTDIPVFLKSMQQMRDEGASMRKIADTFGVTYHYVRNNTEPMHRGKTRSDRINEMRQLRKQGVDVETIAERYGVAVSYLYSRVPMTKRKPVTLDAEDVVLMQALRDEKASVKSIAEKFECTAYTVEKFTTKKEETNE